MNISNIQICVLSYLSYVFFNRGVYLEKKWPVYQNINRFGLEYTLRSLSCTCTHVCNYMYACEDLECARKHVLIMCVAYERPKV